MFMSATTGASEINSSTMTGRISVPESPDCH